MPRASQTWVVDWLRRLTWPLRSPRSRIADAEQRFFDAYNRGGELSDRELVLPLDFFSRENVHEALAAWLSRGDPLDLDALEANWDSGSSVDGRAAFEENVATFLRLLRDPSACRVTWMGPDGRLLYYGSDVFD